jgi:hypothetical protein
VQQRGPERGHEGGIGGVQPGVHARHGTGSFTVTPD